MLLTATVFAAPGGGIFGSQGNDAAKLQKKVEDTVLGLQQQADKQYLLNQGWSEELAALESIHELTKKQREEVEKAAAARDQQEAIGEAKKLTEETQKRVQALEDEAAGITELERKYLDLTEKIGSLDTPDYAVFDLDPMNPDDLDTLRAAALSLRDLLAELGLPSWIKTTGSKGFHIAVPLDGKSDFGTVARFAHVVGQVLVKRDPDHLTQEFSKVDRGGRILVDTGRNGYSATFAAAYTVRAKPGAPVSAPCSWDEVERGDVDDAHLVAARARTGRVRVGERVAVVRRFGVRVAVDDRDVHRSSVPRRGPLVWLSAGGSRCTLRSICRRSCC